MSEHCLQVVSVFASLLEFEAVVDVSRVADVSHIADACDEVLGAVRFREGEELCDHLGWQVSELALPDGSASMSRAYS